MSYLQYYVTENKESDDKLQKNKINQKSHPNGSLHDSSTHAEYISSRSWKFSTLWTTPKTIGKYQHIQNICAKLILQESKYASSTDALHRLHWLPIQQCIEFKILVLSFNASMAMFQNISRISSSSENYKDITYIQTSMEPWETSSKMWNPCCKITQLFCSNTMEFSA